jgi:hypothetical protein
MVTIGDYANCPQCSRLGYIVWVSPNGDTVGIRCSASHQQGGYTDQYGFSRKTSKGNKNSVFLVKTESL